MEAAFPKLLISSLLLREQSRIERALPTQQDELWIMRTSWPILPVLAEQLEHVCSFLHSVHYEPSDLKY